jgi:hypothetical protein
MSDQPGSLPAVDQHQPSISENSDLENSDPNIVSVQQVHGGGEAKIVHSNLLAVQANLLMSNFLGQIQPQQIRIPPLKILRDRARSPLR